MKNRMKISFLIAIISGCLLPMACHAQFALRIEMVRQNYLQYEQVLVRVFMRNDSGHAIAFGHHPRLGGSLEFEIEDSGRHLVSKTKAGKYPVVGLVIKAGETKQLAVPLNRYYDLRKTGRYRVHAYVKHALFENSYRSNECVFNITTGAILWSRTVGIPDFMDKKKRKDGKINSRTYFIKGLFEGPRKVYYMVIEDERRIYCIKRVGFQRGQESFTCDVDMLSRLHILMPISPKVFDYFVYDIHGKLDKRDVYKTTSTIPTLIRDPKTGQVTVAGGEVAKPELDYNVKEDE